MQNRLVKYVLAILLPLIFQLTSCINKSKAIAEVSLGSNTISGRDEITKLVAEHIALYEKGNIKGFAEIYTEDAVVLAQEKEPITGKTKIFEWFNAAYKSGTTGFTVQIDSVWSEKKLMATNGIWTMTNPKGSWAVRGKFVWLWKKIGNQWKVFLDIFNVEPTATITKT
jgi:ketosteroid isomerase-like protein